MELNNNIIENFLAKRTHIAFDVTFENGSYSIAPSKSNQSLFIIKLQIKNGIRLIIDVEPDKYGNAFVTQLSESSKNKKLSFCNYWNSLITESPSNHLVVKINDIPLSVEEYVAFDSTWKKFEVRFTKSPLGENLIIEESLNYLSVICLMILSMLDYDIEGYAEGKETLSLDKRYERNPINRDLCILLNGTKCKVCGVNLEDKYGEIAKGFIEVHHVVPVSKLGDNYIINPKTDLIPVCPNCHSMLHRKDPPYTPEELTDIIKSK